MLYSLDPNYQCCIRWIQTTRSSTPTMALSCTPPPRSPPAHPSHQRHRLRLLRPHHRPHHQHPHRRPRQLPPLQNAQLHLSTKLATTRAPAILGAEMARSKCGVIRAAPVHSPVMEFNTFRASPAVRKNRLSRAPPPSYPGIDRHAPPQNMAVVRPIGIAVCNYPVASPAVFLPAAAALRKHRRRERRGGREKKEKGRKLRF
jgi:hypothetical protein